MNLINNQLAGAKTGFGCSEIKLPHAAELLAFGSCKFIPMLLEPVIPMHDCQCVVVTKHLYIGHLQRDAVDGADEFRERRIVAAGKYVAGDPGIGCARSGGAADGMQQGDAVIL